MYDPILWKIQLHDGQSSHEKAASSGSTSPSAFLQGSTPIFGRTNKKTFGNLYIVTGLFCVVQLSFAVSS